VTNGECTGELCSVTRLARVVDRQEDAVGHARAAPARPREEDRLRRVRQDERCVVDLVGAEHEEVGGCATVDHRGAVVA
jgi:hypothetical protein